MHIFDVLVGLLGGRGPVVLHGGKPKLRRAARAIAGPVSGEMPGIHLSMPAIDMP